jgi:hypothetical protein
VNPHSHDPSSDQHREVPQTGRSEAILKPHLVNLKWFRTFPKKLSETE